MKSRNNLLHLPFLSDNAAVRMDLLPVPADPARGVPNERLTAKVEVSVNAAAASADLYLFGYIASWGDFSAKTVKSYLDDFKAKKVKTVNMKLNSNGGDVFEGNAMYNMIMSWSKDNGVEWNVEVVGIAASMASVLMFCGGKPPKMARGSVAMVHGPRISLDNAPIEKVETMLDLQKQIRQSFTALYVSYTKNTEADVSAWLRSEKWMSAEEALKFGFASEITNSDLIESCLTEEVVASLHLSVPAEFKTLLTAIKQPVKPKPTNKSMDETKTPEQLRIEALEKENNDNKALMAKRLAESLVEAHADRLKLTADAKKHYTELAVANYDTTKALLTSMATPVAISDQINQQQQQQQQPGAEVTAEEKAKWDMKAWMDNDPQGLIKMQKENPTQYNALLNGLAEMRKKQVNG